MILDMITGSVGLSFIDENMDNIISAMSSAGPTFNVLSIAKNVALCLALGVGAYESWMMMLGRRGMDVMKILRIIIISMCISYSPTIASVLRQPGAALESESKAMMTYFNDQLLVQEDALRDCQDDFLEQMFTHLDSIVNAHKAAELAANDNIAFAEEMVELTMLPESINAWAKKSAIWLTTWVCNLLNNLIRWLGELIFQLMYYGIIICQAVALSLMTQFMPLAFALSLAPPFKSAWSQYISKFLSITLWAPICYTMVCYVDQILAYQLKNDAAAVTKITDMSWSAIGGLGLDLLGTSLTYVAGLLVGAKLISMSTEIAGWLIPGGVSSGMGNSVVGGVAGGALAGAAAGVGTARQAIGAVGKIGENNLKRGIV